VIVDLGVDSALSGIGQVFLRNFWCENRVLLFFRRSVHTHAGDYHHG
jgi:hypothetical protein